MNLYTSLFQKWLPCATLFFISYTLSAQMSVTGGATAPFSPQSLINNVFLGDGVEIVSINYTGNPNAVGYFTGANSVVGIDRGIIMTTGRVESSGFFTTGADQNGINFASNDNYLNTNDLDLVKLTTAGLKDLTRYTIRFIPTNDTLRFKYCFASEEYPEYACSSYNDVFGFFISGPGYPQPTNIAVIPGTSLPVAINNLHPFNGQYPNCPPLNAQYYNSNNNSFKQPTYDGFTDVFIAQAVVTPCQEYEIKLCIADVQDGVYDSAVFLEAKSFSVQEVRAIAETVSADGSLVEGCAQGTLTLSIPKAVNQNTSINIKVGGTATNSVDYTTIPSSVSIPAGQTKTTIPLVALQDNIPDGGEFILIDYQSNDCERDTIIVNIRENLLKPPTLRPDTTLCAGASPISLNGTVPLVIQPPMSFSNLADFQIADNSATPTSSPINVFGVQPDILTDGMIQSVCINISHPMDEDLDIYLVSPGGQFVELSTDNGGDGDNYTNTCFTPTATKPIGDPGPASPASEAPFTGTYKAEGPWADLWDGSFPANGTWNLRVRDDNASFSGQILDWTITFEPAYKITYKWSPATGLSCADCPITDANPTASTTYSLVATDSYGCSVSDAVKIDIQPTLPAPNVICNAETNNAVIFGWSDVPNATDYLVSVNGGAWTPANGAFNHEVNGLVPGTAVDISVQAVNGQPCGGLISSATCTTCQSPSVTSLKTDATCFGTSNGTLKLTPDGQNGPYTFYITGQNNNNGNFNNLAAGDYTATVTDASGCDALVDVKISSPPAVTANIQADSVNCFGGADGVLNAAAGGGSGTGYTYSWSTVPVKTGSQASGLAAGVYTLTITDGNGCTSTSSATLSQPAAVALNASSTPLKCFEDKSGTATVTASGGSGPYTYIWSSMATTPLASGLNAGTYTVTVTDKNGCKTNTQAIITQPSEIIGTGQETPANCFGSATGSAGVTATGGTGPYTYKWNDPAGQTTPTATGLVAQSYNVTITDSKGCTEVTGVSVTQPQPIALAVNAVNATCNGASNGTATATPNGGNTPYSYQWNDPLGQTGQTASNLKKGVYTVTVTDSKGCTTTSAVNVDEPAALASVPTVLDATCFSKSDGSVTLATTGGSTPYSYKWSSGENTASLSNKATGIYTVTVTDKNNCTLVQSAAVDAPPQILLSSTNVPVRCFGEFTGSIALVAAGGTPGYSPKWKGPNGYQDTGLNIDGLAAGVYTVTVTDGQQCTETHVVSIQQPASGLSAPLPEIADTICFGAADGSISVNAKGGTAPYTYQWSNGSSNVSQITGLASQAYTVTVVDANDCEFTAQTFVAQKEDMLAYAQATPPLCNGGSDGTAIVTAVFYGANAANVDQMTYQWGTTPPQTGKKAVKLTALQTYSVTVTDANGCSDVQSVTVGDQPAFEAKILETANVKCFGDNTGWAAAGGLGGTKPYSYMWSPGAAVAKDSLAQGLKAGTYTVTVIDAKGCPSTKTATVSQPTELKIKGNTDPAKCFGERSGKVTALPEGGVGPYQFLWATGDKTATLSELAAGNYAISVTDANGCEETSNFTVKQPSEPLQGLAEPTHPRCFGSRDGRIVLNAKGGTPPYVYAVGNQDWKPSPYILGIGSGIYKTKIKDANGCLLELQEVELDNGHEILVDLGPAITLQYGQDTQLVAQVSNSLGQVNYTWAPSDSLWLDCMNCETVNVVGLEYQHYFTVYVSDSTGCRSEDKVLVVVEKPRKVHVPTAFSPNDDGVNDKLVVHGQQTSTVLSFRIFDRWGELVFQGENYPFNEENAGWDGTFRGQPLDPGVYVWILEVKYMDGETEVYKGNTTLIR